MATEKAVITQSHLTDIANAIIAKGGASSHLLPSQMAAAIEAISSGESYYDPEADVRFFDPFGKVIYSCSIEEAQNLNEMPAPPEIEGMTFDGWTHTLEEIKGYHDMLDIGAYYVPSDGCTHVLLKISKEEYREDSMQVTLTFNIEQANGVEIDWGDGSAPTTNVSAGEQRISHTYSTTNGLDKIVKIRSLAGRYIIGINYYCFVEVNGVTTYTYVPFRSVLRGVLMGRGVSGIGLRCLGYCNLEKVTFHGGDFVFGSFDFQMSLLPKHLNLPKVAEVPSGFAVGVKTLNTIAIPFSVRKMTGFEYGGLKRIAVTNSGVEVSSFVRESAIQKVAGLFNVVNNASLYSCLYLHGVVHIGKKIDIECFRGSRVSRFVFHQTETIGRNAFASSYCVSEFDFRLQTPTESFSGIPTLNDVSAFDLLPANCKIVVPDSLYNDWIVATNWSDASIVGHIIKASEYEGA